MATTKSLEKAGAIVADRVFSDGVLVAEDVTFTAPEVELVTAELKAGGNVEVPITGWTEPMEASITHIGVDKGLTHLLRLQRQNIEFRFVQDVVDAAGLVTTLGGKIFLGCSPKTFPGLAFTPGEIGENEITMSVYRYQLFWAGVEQWLIDKFNNIFRVEGYDQLANIRSLL